MAQELDWSSVGSPVEGGADDWSSVGVPVSSAPAKKQNMGLLSDYGNPAQAFDRVVSIAMYDLAESLNQGTIATLISGCRNSAIDAMQSAKPELAAAFIRLGGELMATAGEEVVIEEAVANPSKAIALISAIA